MAQLTFSPDVGHTPHKVSMMISGMQSYMHRAEQALPACDLFLMVFRFGIDSYLQFARTRHCCVSLQLDPRAELGDEEAGGVPPAKAR